MSLRQLSKTFIQLHSAAMPAIERSGVKAGGSEPRAPTVSLLSQGSSLLCKFAPSGNRFLKMLLLTSDAVPA